jgi:hypothetical protein
MDNTLKHFIIWSKGGYGNHTLDEVVCKITASPPGKVAMSDKIYWLKQTCFVAGIDGYDIIDLFQAKAVSQYLEIDYDNELELLLYVMKIKLMLLKTRNNGEPIIDLDITPLFKEEL